MDSFCFLHTIIVEKVLAKANEHSSSGKFGFTEDRLHLRNIQIHLVFHSVCTIFADDMEKKEIIRLFGDKKVRTYWDSEQ